MDFIQIPNPHLSGSCSRELWRHSRSRRLVKEDRWWRLRLLQHPGRRHQMMGRRRAVETKLSAIRAGRRRGRGEESRMRQRILQVVQLLRPLAPGLARSRVTLGVPLLQERRLFRGAACLRRRRRCGLHTGLMIHSRASQGLLVRVVMMMVCRRHHGNLLGRRGMRRHPQMHVDANVVKVSQGAHIGGQIFAVHVQGTTRFSASRLGTQSGMSCRHEGMRSGQGQGTRRRRAIAVEGHIDAPVGWWRRR